MTNIAEPKPEMVECPLCGLEREKDPDDGLYECSNCGAQGYDCCIPGNDALCEECEREASGDADEDDADYND